MKNQYTVEPLIKVHIWDSRFQTLMRGSTEVKTNGKKIFGIRKFEYMDLNQRFDCILKNSLNFHNFYQIKQINDFLREIKI